MNFAAAPIAAPVPAGTAGQPGRLPMRTTGLLAIVAIMVLALLLVAAALLFRGVIKDDLRAVEQAQAREAALVREVLAQPGRAAELARQLHAVEAERARHLAQARQYLDGGTVTMACLAWLGITCAGALALLFFSRLASDISALRARALAILVGERQGGGPLGRNDELGDLAQSLDHLARALGDRERQLAIERRHVMHQEKLAAIGSMAAGVLREIGNPIAAIDGYARAIQELGASGGTGACDVAPILHETARLAAITHGISELAAAPATLRQLTSLNEIVAKSVGLLRYEPRLELVAVVTRLDPQLPAVPAVADRLVLLTINLLTNAADAMAALAPRTGRIELATRAVDDGVELCVTDNGCGMDEAVRRRAFEPLFTTKPAGRGTGLGLPLCRTIADEHGGRIAIDSAPGAGTRVRVWLPLRAPAASAD